MDFDPNFEFECPKWYDFAREEEEEEELCLDDSWFEREHPLHEPKDKEKNVQELKPLIEIDEKQIDIKKSMGPKKTDNNTKYKKSLGVNKKVQLLRGENGQKRRKLPDATRMKRRSSSEGTKNSKEQKCGRLKVDKTSSKGDFSNNNDFTPPWGMNSPSTKPGTSGESDISPKTALLYSPLRGPLMSPPINSPKNTLLAKAVNKTAGTNHKRRMLPAVPCSYNTQNRDISSHLPLRGTTASQSDNQSPQHSIPESNIKESNSPAIAIVSSGKNLLNPSRQNTDVNSTVMTMNNQRQEQEDSSISVEELLKQHNQKVLASKRKYDSNGRRIQRRSGTTPVSADLDNKKSVLNTIDQNNSEVFITQDEITAGTCDEAKTLVVINEEGILKNPSLKEVHVESQPETTTEMTAEALLKLHNQRVMASKCKYDSNGRRIRTANPSFCAAPSKSDEPEKPSIAKNKGRTLVGKKRHSSSTTHHEARVTTTVKQQRRSCIADLKTQDTLHGAAKRFNVERGTKSSTSTCSTADIPSKSSSSDLKRHTSSQDGLKNKRRSCVAAPISSLQMAGLTKSTGVAAQNRRQKRRSCVAAPQTPKRLASDSNDQELKDMIARHNQRIANNK